MHLGNPAFCCWSSLVQEDTAGVFSLEPTVFHSNLLDANQLFNGGGAVLTGSISSSYMDE